MPQEHTFNGERVLVLDDDMRTVFGVSALLERMSLDVSVATTAARGAEIMAQDEALKVVIARRSLMKDGALEAWRRRQSAERENGLALVLMGETENVEMLEGGPSTLQFDTSASPDSLAAAVRAILAGEGNADG